MKKKSLSGTDLAKIWTLSDRDQDHKLNQDEFAIAMHLINAALQGTPVPDALPDGLGVAGNASAQAEAQQPEAKPEKAKPKANYDIDLNSIVSESVRFCVFVARNLSDCLVFAESASSSCV